MSELLLVTGVLEPSSEVLPALGLLLHSVRVLPADASALVEAPPADVVLVDARRDLAHAKSICRLLHTTGLDCPMLAIVTEGGLAAISAEWNADDVILNTAGPAEVEARLRLATGRRALRAAADAPDEIRSGDLAIDEATYSARLRGRVLDLTFKEFELLKFLAQHPGPGVHQGAPAAGGLGVRLLRRHPDRGRARPAAARQARPRARGAHRHRAERRLPVRPGEGLRRRTGSAPT